MPDHLTNRHPPSGAGGNGGGDDSFVGRALQFLDGLLDEEQVRQFNAELAASAERRETFVALCELRGHLFEHRLAPADADGSDEPALVPPPWFEAHPDLEPAPRRRPYLAIAAAILLPLLLTTVLYVALRPRETPTRMAGSTPPTASRVATAPATCSASGTRRASAANGWPRPRARA